MRGAFREIVIPTELATLLYEKYLWEVPEGYRPKQFFVARSPDGHHLALYADPYLYLYDTSTQSLCEAVVGESTFRYPLKVQWSPDGQTLAMLTTDTPSSALVESPEIIVLNITSGEQKQLRLEGDPVGIAWGPDSRYLLVMSRLDKKQWRPIDKLFLVDGWSGATRLLFPDQTWGGGSRFGVSDVAWSPNGQEIAIKCPNLDEKEGIIVEDRICLISVKIDQ
jgi:dipeptidyl aminopeptidase/acylaminoacyl peptidase